MDEHLRSVKLAFLIRPRDVFGSYGFGAMHERVT